MAKLYLAILLVHLVAANQTTVTTTEAPTSTAAVAQTSTIQPNDLDEITSSSWSHGPNGKLYKNLYKPQQNKENSSRLCEAEGGHLPKPRNRDESNFLKTFEHKFYIGANDKNTEGRWDFDDDDLIVTWFDWIDWGGNIQEPNGGANENCVSFWQYAGKAGWVDISCAGHDKITTVICEKSTAVTTTQAPTSTAAVAQTSTIQPDDLDEIRIMRRGGYTQDHCEEIRDLNETDQSFRCYIGNGSADRGEGYRLNVTSDDWYWSKDGRTIEYGNDWDRVNIVREDRYHALMLTLKRVFKEDEGRYTCHYNGEMKSFNLTVVEGRDTDIEVRADEGSDFSFTCPNYQRVEGHPYFYTWWIVGKERRLLYRNSSGNLRKTNLRKEDAGIYECKIQDYLCHQDTHVRLQLTVTDPDEVRVEGSTCITNERCEEFRQLNQADEMFVCYIGEGVVDRGEDYSLSEAEDFFWSKDVTIISNDSTNNVYVEKSERHHRLVLILKKITKEDEGRYTCHYKTHRKTFNLTVVKGRVTIYQRRSEESDFTFTCPNENRREGHNYRYHWSGPQYNLWNANLTKKTLRKGDAGIYKCTIYDYNCIGQKQEVTLHLTVSGCRSGWRNYNYKTCYGFFSHRKNWHGAEVACRQYLGGKLAEPYQGRMQKFLKQLARDHNARTAWLGGTDIAKEGKWHWKSNNWQICNSWPVCETDWYERPDNYRNQDCLQMARTEGYKWDDNDCSLLTNYICETPYKRS